MPENTLFYSKHCKHCKDFILKLKSRGLLDLFTKKICIEDPRTGRMRRNLPPFLKEVPTILVDDYDQPLSSDMAFKWIEFKKKQVVEEETGGTGIQDYDTGSMFGTIGDNGSAYSGLGDSNALKKDGHSSVMYQESLLPPNMMQAASESNGANGDFDKRLEKLQMSRSLDNSAKGGNSGGMPMAYSPM